MSSSARKRRRATTTTTTEASKRTKRGKQKEEKTKAEVSVVGPLITDAFALEDAQWTSADVKIREDCKVARYAMSLWAASCFDPEKPRMRTEECFMRDTLRERLQEAIETSVRVQQCQKEGADKGYQLDAAFYADSIERLLFWRWYYLQPAMYRQRCRQIEFNLERNGWYLLTRFGPLTVCAFPTRKLAEGTAVDDWRTDYRQRSLRDLKPPTPTVDEKGLFQCPNGKCKGWRTTYYAMQTRGADEPMTNFVTCHDCGTHFRRS